MTDIGDLPPEIQEAERRGFISGLNVGLVSIAVLSSLVAALRSLEVPRFEEVFKQVKVPMPGLTLLVLKTHQAVAGLLVFGAILCIWATRKRAQERWTIVLNALLFGFSILWFLIVSASLHMPLISLLEGIGAPRR